MLTHPVVREAVRAYTWRELPGWGRVYRHLVGDFRHNQRWTGKHRGWVRGKTHGFEMLLDLGSWSNRFTFYTGRYADTGNQILVRALLKAGDTFLDIGANEGMISLEAARQVGKRGKVIAFEPNPGPGDLFAAAIRRNGLTQVDLRRVGLSDEPQTLTLHIPAINSGEGSFARISSKDDVSTVEAAVMVGDDELAGVTPALVKIDVEGFELHVLKGLTGLLGRAKPPISIEFNPEALEAAGTSSEELHGFLTSRGYTGFVVETHGRGKAQRAALSPVNLGAAATFDALYVQDASNIVELLSNVGPY